MVRRRKYERLLAFRLEEQDFATSIYLRVFDEVLQDPDVDLAAVREDINKSCSSLEETRFLNQFVYDLELTQQKVFLTEGLIKHTLERNSLQPTGERIGKALFLSGVGADPVGEVKASVGIASLKIYIGSRTDYVRLYGKFSVGTGFFKPYQKVMLPLEGTQYATSIPLSVIFTGEGRSENQIRQTEMHEEAHAINQRLIVTRATLYSKERKQWQLYHGGKIEDLVKSFDRDQEIAEAGIPLISSLFGRRSARLATLVEASSYKFAMSRAQDEIIAMQSSNGSYWEFIFSYDPYDYYQGVGLRLSQLGYSHLGQCVDKSRDRYLKSLESIFEYVGLVRSQIAEDEQEKLTQLLREIPISRWKRELRRRYGVSVIDERI